MADVETLTETVTEQFGSFLIAGGGTSIARLNLKRYKARKQYSDSTLFNQGQLLLYQNAIELISQLANENVPADSLPSNLDEWRMSGIDSESKSKEHKLLKDRLKACKD